MARPRIKNLDQKILQEVMNQTYEKGIQNVSTKRIATKLKISEPTIFAHFQTKKNLMLSAFAEAWSVIPHLLVLPTVSEEKEDSYQQYREKVMFAYENLKATHYVASYVRSAYFKETQKECRNIQKLYRLKVEKAICDLNPNIQYDSSALPFLVDNFIESSINNINYVCGFNSSMDENILRFIYRTRFFGFIYALKMVK